jgi:hypothetical protein
VFRAFDPDWSRLRIACRALVASAATAAVSVGLARAFREAPSLSLAAISVAMSASRMVREPNARQEQKTLAVVFGCAGASLALGTALWGRPWLQTVAVLGVVFAAVAARRWGARGSAAGMAAFLAYFSSIFLRASLASLPWMLLDMAAAMVVTYVGALVFLRDDPAHRLRSIFEAYVRSVGLAVGAVARGGPSKRELDRLHGVALALDDELEGSSDPAARRARLHALVLQAAIERARTDDPSTLEEVRRSEADLRRAFAELRSPASAWTGASPSPSPAASLHPATRAALQAVVAVGVASIAGRAISETRWYWAILAAYVMFVRGSTVSETVARGWARVVGTLAGVVGGTMIGTAVGGHTWVAVAVAFASVFVGTYLMQVSYAVFVFTVTLMVTALYDLLGRFSDAILWLRLAETLAGCMAGALAAALLLPSHAHARAKENAGELLSRLAGFLEAVVREADADTRRDCMRSLESSLRALEEAASPLTQGLFRMANEPLRRQVKRLGATVAFARQLAAMPHEAEQATSTVVAAASEAARHARDLAGALRGDHAPQTFAPVIGRGPPASLEWIAWIDAYLSVLACDLARTALTPSRPGSPEVPERGS